MSVRPGGPLVTSGCVVFASSNHQSQDLMLSPTAPRRPAGGHEPTSDHSSLGVSRWARLPYWLGKLGDKSGRE
jgi:hypothetical protein